MQTQQWILRQYGRDNFNVEYEDGEYRSILCTIRDYQICPEHWSAKDLAKLIVKAPQMRQALEAVIPFIEHNLGGWSNGVPANICPEELLKTINEALPDYD